MTCTCVVTNEDVGLTTPCGTITEVDVIQTGTTPFDSAVGAGAGAIGGRGATVYKVTNLNDSGAGSLRAALEAIGPRAIVFEVGGTITLNNRIVVTSGDFSIYGHTAPGDGIQVRGQGGGSWPGGHPLFDIRTGNFIWQGMRARLGDGGTVVAANSMDNMFIGLNGTVTNNIMISHSSFQWAVDENINSWFRTGNITVQNCIIAEGLVTAGHDLTDHSWGIEIGQSNSGCFTLYENLLSMNKNRGIDTRNNGLIEVINNIFYTHDLDVGQIRISDQFATALGGHEHNIQNNLQLLATGAANNGERFIQVIDFGNGIDVYIDGNIDPFRTTQAQPFSDSVDPGDLGFIQNTTRHPVCAQIPDSAIQDPALAGFVADILSRVGATPSNRDPVDTRIVNDVTGLTGNYINSPTAVGGYPALSGGVAPTDTSGDGIPDTFKTAMGWTVATDDTATIQLTGPNAGRSYLEIYVNSLLL